MGIDIFVFHPMLLFNHLQFMKYVQVEYSFNSIECIQPQRNIAYLNRTLLTLIPLQPNFLNI